ncbi:hypothetical protein DESC_880073 [Desulfosarcina cetonica]|nr:hypothetical protein DESC_880073 [Desulfosarcina cetonica]
MQALQQDEKPGEQQERRDDNKQRSLVGFDVLQLLLGKNLGGGHMGGDNDIGDSANQIDPCDHCRQAQRPDGLVAHENIFKRAKARFR